MSSLSVAPLEFGPNQPERFYRGGDGIARFRGRSGSSAYAPEDFIASTTELFGSEGLGLSYLSDGLTLRQAILDDPVGFLGSEHVARFGANPGLLVKMLDTGERLLVHFHPDGDFARRHLGCAHGKNEAWLITEVVVDESDPTSGAAFIGFSQATTLATVSSWMQEQDAAAMLDALNRIDLRAGDAILVPAGVPHAIGAGVTMVEVQEPLDLSILLEWEGFEIDGPRVGHLGVGFDVALEALDLDAWSLADVEALRRPRPGNQSSGVVTPLLPSAADPFFRVERLVIAQELQTEADLAVLVVLDGEGELTVENSPGSMHLSQGSTVLVPHGAGGVTISGSTTLLRCRPATPELTAGDWLNDRSRG